MAAQPIRRPDLAQPTLLDWVLILTGTLLAWHCWPPTHL